MALTNREILSQARQVLASKGCCPAWMFYCNDCFCNAVCEAESKKVETQDDLYDGRGSARCYRFDYAKKLLRLEINQEALRQMINE